MCIGLVVCLGFLFMPVASYAGKPTKCTEAGCTKEAPCAKCVEKAEKKKAGKKEGEKKEAAPQ